MCFCWQPGIQQGLFWPNLTLKEAGNWITHVPRKRGLEILRSITSNVLTTEQGVGQQRIDPTDRSPNKAGLCPAHIATDCMRILTDCFLLSFYLSTFLKATNFTSLISNTWRLLTVIRICLLNAPRVDDCSEHSWVTWKSLVVNTGHKASSPYYWKNNKYILIRRHAWEYH